MSIEVTNSAYLNTANDYRNNPIAIFENLGPVGGYSSSHAPTAGALVNLWNPTTCLYAEFYNPGAAAVQEIVLDLGSAQSINSIAALLPGAYTVAGIASITLGHGTTLGTYIVRTVPCGSAALNRDEPAAWYFDTVSARYILLSITIPSGKRVKVANLLAGMATVFERREFVGARPPMLNTIVDRVNTTTESGQFGGSILLTRGRELQLQQSNCTRTYFDVNTYRLFNHVIDNVPGKPTPAFYYSWRPLDFPGDTVYCWPSGAPQFTNQTPNGLIEWSLSARALF